MRCAIYRRVSTDLQKEEGFSLEAQKMRLEAYAVSQGWSLIEDYADEGFSAKNTDRPALQRMIQDMKLQKFDIILVYRLDRFVRSVLDLHELLQLMDQHDVKFKSATEVFDTTSASGRMFITMIATLAQWERETIAERVFDSTLKRSEKGFRPGAPRPYGYNQENGKLIVHEEEAKWVRYMFEQYQSIGTQTIAIRLNQQGVKTKKGDLWDGSTVRYIIDNPIYCGLVRWNHRGTKGGRRYFTGDEVVTEIQQEDFEPIISQELYKSTQALLKQRKVSKIRSDNYYPFSTILRCPRCGNKIVGNTVKRSGGRKYRFYRCHGRHKYGICDLPNFSEESINQAFLDSLDHTLDTPEVIEKQEQMSEAEIKKKQQQLLHKKERIEELYIEGEIKKDRYHELMDEVRSDEQILLEIQSRKKNEVAAIDIKAFLLKIKKEWDNMNYESQKRAIHTLFESLTVNVIKKGTTGLNPKPAVLEIVDCRFR